MRKHTLVLVLLPFLACASNKAAVTAAGEPSAAPSASAAPEPSAAASASVAAVASATPSASAAPTATEAPDPCVPVSAAFETKVRPQVKQCFFDALGKNPALSGNVHLTLHVDPTGKVKAINIGEEKELGKDAVACMKKVINAGAFEGKDCAGKGFTLAMAFGNAARTPH
jgi:hypothetical protein